MKRTNATLILALLTTLSTPSAWADHDRRPSAERYEDFAQVISATPEYERVNRPEQSCSTDYLRTDGYRSEADGRERSYAGTIVGGVAGALVGSRFGKGKGNRVATAAGAIAGAVIGDQIQGRDQASRCGGRPAPAYEPVQRCRVIDHWDDRLLGYRVVYEYGGRTYNTFLPYDPGNRLAVRVAVSPAQ